MSRVQETQLDYSSWPAEPRPGVKMDERITVRTPSAAGRLTVVADEARGAEVEFQTSTGQRVVASIRRHRDLKTVLYVRSPDGMLVVRSVAPNAFVIDVED